MKTIKQLLIMIAVLLCSATTYAYDFEVDGIYYNIISLEDLTVEVTYIPYGYTDYSGEVVIPSTVNYNGEVYSVTSIGEKAFYECSSLTSVMFGENSQLTSIGEKAFYKCSSLTNVMFGENSQLTSIGGGAFYNCDSLTSIEIPGSVISIESGDNYGGYVSGVFAECSNLTTVIFGENSQLTSIGDYAFYNCSSLTSIEIPNSVTSIGVGAFYDCDGLASIEIPDSVISIESPDYSIYPPCGAFGSCSNLKTVKFGENSQLNSIGEFAFVSCSSLTSVEIPNSVTSIGGGAFYNCDSLTSIEIPDSVISIEGVFGFGYHYGAFDFCCDLKTVTFGENSQLTSIGDAAFRECTSLTSIEIPNSVTTIGGGAFYNCDSLTSIEIPDSVISIEECLYSPLSGYYGAFENCSNLKTVTFGKNSQLTSIGGGTFYDCDSLTSIEIPSSVISIESHHIGVFGECSNLKIVTFSENSQLASIGRYAFAGCSMTSIEIPNSVTSIGEYAFSGCTSLKDFKIEDGYTTLELGYHLFKNCPLETIYLGRNISYDNSENPENLLFDDLITLKTLTVGSSVTEIPGKTFYDCSNLESVYMRGVPPIIYDDTFSNASFYIATLYVPEGTLAFYQTANIWKNFWNIQEYEPTSIEDIEADEVNFTITSNGISFSNANNTTICIYTINGILVEKIDKYTGEDIILNKGIYIVSVGNKTVKIKL